MSAHEVDRIDGGRAIKLAAGSVVVFFVSLGVAAALLVHAPRETPRPAPAVIGSLEQTPILDGDRGRKIQDDERKRLGEWRWVDRDAGLAEMPVDLAIDRLLDGGAP